jgi:hypothetical protein
MLRDLLVSIFLFIRSKRRSRASFFGRGNTRYSGRETKLQGTVYEGSPTRNHLRRRHPWLPVGLSPLAGLQAQDTPREHTTRTCYSNNRQERSTTTRSHDHSYKDILQTTNLLPVLGGAAQPSTSSLVDPVEGGSDSTTTTGGNGPDPFQ